MNAPLKPAAEYPIFAAMEHHLEVWGWINDRPDAKNATAEKRQIDAWTPRYLALVERQKRLGQIFLDDLNTNVH